MVIFIYCNYNGNPCKKKNVDSTVVDRRKLLDTIS